MAKFDLIIDEKVAVWRRSYVTVDADTLDDAVKECIKEGSDAATEILESIYLPETEELISSLENNEITIEVMNRKFEILGTNN